MTRILISIFLIAVAAFIFFAPLPPLLDQIEELKVEKAELNAALDNAKEIIAVREELTSRYNQFSSADLTKLDKLLPNNVDNVRLIIDINSIALKYGMVLKNIVIRTEEQIAAGTALGPVPSSGQFRTVELGFSVSGDYEALRNFLSDLGRSLRLVDIASVNFSPDLSTGLANYKISLRTYWLKEI